MAAKLPDYVLKANVPANLLILVHCRNVACGNTKKAIYSRLSDPNWQKKGMEMGSITATCLKCGEVAFDSYNWSRP